MPNPVRGIKRTDLRKLSPKQKGIVNKLRRAKLPVKVYQRGRGLSVHNPLLDVRRKAKKGSLDTTKRYPHARDTEIQRMVRFRKAKVKGARKAPPSVKKKILLP